LNDNDENSRDARDGEKMNLSKLKSARRFVHRVLRKKLEQKIFFMAIPKCGGTSTGFALRQCYGVTKTRRNSFYFQLDSRASLKASQCSGTNRLEFLENLLIYNMSIPTLKYIDGHFLYSERAHAEFKEQWAFITLFRHPVSKWFSKYFYNRYKQSSHYRLDSDLETYSESERGIADGSDYVSWLTGLSLKDDAISDRAVEHAIRNLDNFTLIGVLEKMDLFVRDFHKTFGVKLDIEHLRKNPLSKNKQEKEITDRVKKRVEEICQPNIKVYQAALERIEGRPFRSQ
jgi:hypothetical protein